MNSYGNISFDYTRLVFIVLGTLGDRQANKLKCVKKIEFKKTLDLKLTNVIQYLDLYFLLSFFVDLEMLDELYISLKQF